MYICTYIGEWQGDTGTKGFEKLLSAEYTCEEILPLPNWGDTSYCLMVWQRRSGGSGGAGKKGSSDGNKKSGGAGAKAGAQKGVISAPVPEHLLPHNTHPFRCSACGTGRTEGTTNVCSSNSSTSEASSSASGTHIQYLITQHTVCTFRFNCFILFN